MASVHRLGSRVDFPEALAALPMSESEIRAWLREGFDIPIEKRVPHPSDSRTIRDADKHEHRINTRYRDALWIYQHVVQAKGPEAAAGLVAHLILSGGGTRVTEVAAAVARGQPVDVQAHDPHLVRLLFDEGSPTELGRYVADYWGRTATPDAVLDAPTPSHRPRPRERAEARPPRGRRAEDDEEVQDVGGGRDVEGVQDPEGREDVDAAHGGNTDDERTRLDLPGLLRALQLDPEDRRSADPRAGLAFDHILAPPRQLLTAEPSWSEARLRTFLLDNWERIDWGFSSPLYLIGGNVQLDAAEEDRVDILAKGGTGQLVAIELTTGEATPGDVSRVQALMKHLDQRGPGRTFGLLVAADFPHRTLKVAEQHPRLRLLRFRSS